MRLSRTIAKYFGFTVILAASAVLAQAEDKKHDTEKHPPAKQEQQHNNSPQAQHQSSQGQGQGQASHTSQPSNQGSGGSQGGRTFGGGTPASGHGNSSSGTQPSGRGAGSSQPANPATNQPNTHGNNPSGGQTFGRGSGGNQSGDHGNNPAGGQTVGRGSSGNQPNDRGNNPSGGQTYGRGSGGNQPGDHGNNPSGGQTVGRGSGGNQPNDRGNSPSGGQTFGRGSGGNQPNRNFGNGPSGNQSPRGGFGSTPADRGGPSQYGNRPGGGSAPRVYTTGRGDVIHRDSHGDVRQVRMSNGSTIYHPPNGPRRIEVVRPGGRMIVAGAPGHGYIQRPIVVHNTTIIKRTYIYNGVPRAMVYRPHMYHGVSLAIYTPVRYYRPSFYAYAYNPWARPVYYSWGWNSRPWYGYYGGYFTPYPTYASPALWLTDFVIAATLENAYEERMAARAGAASSVYQDSGPAAPMSPEVKQAISDEVRRQIDYQRAAGQNASAPPPETDIFSDNTSHVFVVSSSLQVNSNAGECLIAEGDVLRLSGAPGPNATSADVTVLSSRGNDCRRGSLVSVGLSDLQEMHNQMLATIDRGLSDLQSKQGQGGLPTLPQGSAGTIDTPFAQEAQPDSNVASELSSASLDADRAEQQAISQGGDTGGSTPTLTLGLSINQVKAIQGEPTKIVDMGAKQIYVYRDLKITFSDGRVTDIQ